MIPDFLCIRVDLSKNPCVSGERMRISGNKPQNSVFEALSARSKKDAVFLRRKNVK
jgi:hypothetical protein